MFSLGYDLAEIVGKEEIARKR